MPQFDTCSLNASGTLDGSETVAVCQGGNNVQIPLADIVAFTIQTLLTSGALDIQGGSLTVSGGAVNVPGGPVTLPTSELSQNGDAFVLGDGGIGSWRFIRDGASVVVQRHESAIPVGIWVTKRTFSA